MMYNRQLFASPYLRLCRLILFIAFYLLAGWQMGYTAQPTPADTPASLETIRTEGGLEITFPADLFAVIDLEAPNKVSLTDLRPGTEFSNLTIQDASDTWEGEDVLTLMSVRDSILRSIRLIGETVEDAPIFALPNGELTVVPYTLDDGGGGLFALLETPSGHIAVAEILVEDSQDLTQLLEKPQAWIAILATIRFVETSGSNGQQLPQLTLPDRPLALDEMPVDAIVFSSDVLLPLTPAWLPADATGESSDEVVEDTMTIAHNGAEALATIVVVDTDDIPFVDWRNTMLSIVGDTLIAEGEAANVRVSERNDGRVVEQYTSQDQAIALFFVDLGADRAAYVLVTMIETRETRRQQILDSLLGVLLEMTRFIRVD